MQRLIENDIAPHIALAVFGASESIEIGISPFHPEWFRYVRDIAFLGDSRLTRRMLLPGYDSQLSSGVARMQKTSIVSDVRTFLREGWEVKTAPYSRLGFTIMIDREAAFHSYPSQERDSVKMAVALPELSLRESKRELHELIWQFDEGWKEGEIFETVYQGQEEEEDDDEEQKRIIQLSDEHFKDLLKHFAKHPEKMREMDPHKFEEFVANLFQKEGFKVELAKISRDGGRDILVTSETELGKHLHLVECKRYAAHRSIDVTLIRSLYGVVEKERATAGLLVTTTRLTNSALQEIDQLKNRVSKKDYDDVVKWIKKHA